MCRRGLPSPPCGALGVMLWGILLMSSRNTSCSVLNHARFGYHTDSCFDARAICRTKKLTSTARDPTSTPRPVPSARPKTSPAPSVRSDPGMKHTVVNIYTKAKARAPCPGLSSTHSRKDLRVSSTKPSPSICARGRAEARRARCWTCKNYRVQSPGGVDLSKSQIESWWSICKGSHEETACCGP